MPICSALSRWCATSCNPWACRCANRGTRCTATTSQYLLYIGPGDPGRLAPQVPKDPYGDVAGFRRAVEAFQELHDKEATGAIGRQLIMRLKEANLAKPNQPKLRVRLDKWPAVLDQASDSSESAECAEGGAVARPGEQGRGCPRFVLDSCIWRNDG